MNELELDELFIQLNKIITKIKQENEAKNLKIKQLDKYLSDANEKNSELTKTNEALRIRNHKLASEKVEYQKNEIKSEQEKDGLVDEIDQLTKEKKELDIENDHLLRENNELKKEKNELRDQLEKKTFIQKEPAKTPAHYKNTGANPVLSLFNAWAARPTTNLPDNFIFVEGFIEIRTPQKIVTTPNDTEWIITKGDGVRFLFPNPVFFNDRTDISRLYEGEMNNLKSKDNRIEVLKACEMSESGYIDFKGKFRLL